MSAATVFKLAPDHLGEDRLGRIFLHARISAALDRSCADVPDGWFDVRDGHDDSIPVPERPEEYMAAVGEFDVLPGMPHKVVVFGEAAVARFGAAVPDILGRPYDGTVFVLDGEHLSLDKYGLVGLAEEVRQAIDVAGPGNGPECLAFKVFDGDGKRAVYSGDSDPSDPFIDEGAPVSRLNGFEPRYVVFQDRRAAERFAARLPGMRRERLVELERLWRKAGTG